VLAISAGGERTLELQELGGNPERGGKKTYLCQGKPHHPVESSKKKKTGKEEKRRNVVKVK